MSIPTSFNPLGTLGNVKLLESCLFAQSYVATDVFSSTNERFDFDISYVEGLSGGAILDLFGYLDSSTRRILRKYGGDVGWFQVFHGPSAGDNVLMIIGSNDVVGSLNYANGVVTADLNGVITTHSCTNPQSRKRIAIGLRETDAGKFRFRNLKVTQNGALSGDFVPCLVGEEICILNKVTRIISHATAGKLSL